MYPSKMPYFNTENPVVRDELWDRGFDDEDDEYDDDEYGYTWLHGKRYRYFCDNEPDWDRMYGGHDRCE